MQRRDNPSGADNQQERPLVSPEFIAGVLVGEGSFYLRVNKRQNDRHQLRHGIQILPAIVVGMNDAESVDAVIDGLHALGLEFNVQNQRIDRRGYLYNKRISAVGHKRCKPWCEVFIPLLTGKKRLAAQTLMEYIEYRTQKPRPYSYGEVDAEIVNRLREINGGIRESANYLESSETIRQKRNGSPHYDVLLHCVKR